MTLDRGWALALLAVPAVLLLLRLRAARPREAEASSLLVWEKVSQSDTPRSRPRPPLEAWLEALGAALLVLGLAGPSLAAAPPARVRVLLDASPSMEARRPGGGTRREAALAALAGAEVRESGDLPGDLRSLLGTGGPVVVATDRRLPGFPDDPPRLRVLGFGDRVFDAGIAAAAGEPLPDGRWRVFLTVEAHGSPGPVQGVVAVGKDEVPVVLGQDPATVVVLDVALPPMTASIRFPGDSFAGDDRMAWRIHPSLLRDAEPGSPPRRGPVLVMAPAGDRSLDPVVRALEACGVETRISESPAPGRKRAVLFPEGLSAGGPRSIPGMHFPVEATGGEVLGRDVASTGHPLAEGVRIDPSVRMGRRGASPEGGEVVLADGEGALVARTPWIEFGFLPGGDWVDRDPSFVVLVRNIVEEVYGGAALLEASDLVDPEEIREAALGESFGDPAAALAEASLPDPAARTPLALWLLLAGAASLGAAWWVGR